MNYAARQQQIAAALTGNRLSGLLVTHLPNVRYLCGFTGSAGVLAVALARGGRAKFAFFTDGRYSEQARDQVCGARVVIAKGSALSAAVEWLSAQAPRGPIVGLEAEHMSVVARSALAKLLPHKIRWKATTEMVERLRMIKQPAEIEQMRASALLAASVFDAVVGSIRPGMAESNVAAEIEYLCRRLGAEGMAFDTLVSSGPRSALPHGVASQQPIPANGFVIIDFGVILGGYCSDMTRTVHVGAPGKWAKQIYSAVKEAQLAGIAEVKPGVETSNVDQAARKILEKSGLGRYFTHSTGHGVGLEVHEPPGLRKAALLNGSAATKAKPQRLLPGMVITIEPGVYIPGKGGVRIEDMVVVTETGCDILTPTTKDLIVL